MAAPILSLPVIVNANNALVVSIGAVVAMPVVTGTSAPAPLPSLKVATDSSNRLLIKIV